MRKLRNQELNRLSISEFKKADKIPLVVVLDNVRSMNNVGSVFRSADAFLVEAVYLCGITARPPHKDIHKTALGATESVFWKYFENTGEALADLRLNNYITIAIEQTIGSTKLEKYVISKEQRYAVVFGNEIKGVSQQAVDACDTSIDIDQYGTKHSLNISVCAGIVIWEFFKKLKA